MTLTPATLKALRFLSSREGTTAIELAEEMWPDSPAWRKQKQVGGRGGISTGAAMFRPAQGLLGKMAKAGLVERDFRRSVLRSVWIATPKGRGMVDAIGVGR